jgi:hypothetical protein
MKKYVVLLVSFLLTLSTKAQLPVSTLPQNKKVVIEHFTAMNCQFSPDGDMRAAKIYTADPSNVVLIQIHNGPWATPTVAGTPSFTTAYGNAIGTMPGLNMTGWPAAAINRTVMPAFSQSTANPGMAQNRNWWDSAAKIIKVQPAYCNIALQGTVDVSTRVLTVEAEVYYTANSPVSTNSLHIVLLEDSIHGPIFNPFKVYLNNYNPDSSYNHNNLLRAGLTPSFGLTIPNTTSGTTFSTTATYTIPLLFGTGTFTNYCLLGRLKLAAFVTETHSITINAARGPITLTGFNNSLDIGTNTLKTDAYICSGNNFLSSFRFINYGSTPVNSAVVSYSMNGAALSTYTWSGFPVGPYQQSQAINLPSSSFLPVATNTMEVGVVTVNNLSDQNPMNDVATRTIMITPYVSNNVNMKMNFNQDKYGSEVGWVIYDESTWTAVPGASVAVGTYTDLATSGTLLHVHNFTVNPSGCYRLVVTDTYGDGVNGGWGAGSYNVMAGSTIVLSSTGQYGKGESRWYSTTVSAGLDAAKMYINGITIFPNPASTNVQLEMDLMQNETLSVRVVNCLGQEIYSSSPLEYQAGRSQIALNTSQWSSGVYNINITSSKGTVSRKLIVE